MSKITIIGIDLAKNVFHLHAVDSTGRQVKAIKLSRLKLTEYLVSASQRTHYGCNGSLCKRPSLGQVMPVAGP